MINADINLLPDKIIESLHRGKFDKERWYFLIAIALTLVITTGVLGGVLFFMNRATTESEALLANQLERMDTLNSFWSEIMVLSQSSEYVMPMQADLDEIRTTWDGVQEHLQGVTLVSFARIDAHTYRIEAQAANAQESTRFLQDLRQALPATIELDTIQQAEDEVLFSYHIQY